MSLPTPAQRILIHGTPDAGAARRQALRIATDAGLDADLQSHVMLVVTEMATNLVRHAGSGTIISGPGPIRGVVDVWSLDHGPGLPHDGVWKDGVSTRGTQGLGLGAIRRMSDVLNVHSTRSGTILHARFGSADGRVVALQLCADNGHECGDALRVHIHDNGGLAILADGLGHGTAAQRAARVAVDSLHAAGPPASAMQRVSEALQGQDYLGSSAVIARIGRRLLTACSVGDARVAHIRNGTIDTIPTTLGRLGRLIERPNTVRRECIGGDVAALYTDGLELPVALPPDVTEPGLIAGYILRDHLDGRDDASLVLMQVGAAAR